MKNRSKNMPSGKSAPKKANKAVAAYKNSADVLGSYTGVTDAMNTMPCPKLEAQAKALAEARMKNGKEFCRADDLPVQDADDL